VHRDRKNKNEKGREQAARAPNPKPTQANRPGGTVFSQKNGRNEVTREEEEKLNAEISARKTPRVKRHDGQHRQPAKSIEGGNMRNASRARGRHGHEGQSSERIARDFKKDRSVSLPRILRFRRMTDLKRLLRASRVRS